MPSITLTLPEQTLEQAAAVLQRLVEDVVSALLDAVLPSLHDVPDNLRIALLRMMLTVAYPHPLPPCPPHRGRKSTVLLWMRQR